MPFVVTDLAITNSRPPKWSPRKWFAFYACLANDCSAN